MLRDLLKIKKGFTLIEVVIVLAIAGLIFVIVFLAVSQAQAARRDTHRKSLANQVLAAVNQYASNNNGGIPGAASPCTALSAYVPALTDPEGGTIVLNCVSTTGGAVSATLMEVGVGRACNGTNFSAATSSREYAVRYWQERGGAQCQAGQ